ncbi:2-succinyl-5-enolpyruvyl-6-hydroxy-3-cyclohexene-1-carboxylate synthase [Hyunsoonleella aestuarii]|uniref:2-succinyl-5-enolpyruvyl-6-hydroxy-3-cyclohexene-1-carboxylate synthase n=1 Tax=Hyunsoonleella aestuarii TaxID=912802 RepID=A0ABP8ED44_9FLAO|nr:2-succinyl-5-enolpyruvyl-6-hydroxy-3-cyclohexene-1-carboxylate synthase [Hyunsoonleella aestuarii]
MIYPKIPLAQTVVQLCKAKNIKHIIISPGSRNAPLTIGFTNDRFFTCYSIVDERCAAFFAIGIAQQLGEPTAVVCTSGSALLNYYPAVAEAFYSNIPLLVLSADRPKHLIGIGDGQTINQKHVFEKHILYSANLKLDLKDEKNIPPAQELPIMKNLENKLERFLGLQKDIQIYNEEELNVAINYAIHKKGPVHVNVPFDEPLYETEAALSIAPKLVDIQRKLIQLDDYTIMECLDTWVSAQKKMILVGSNAPNAIEQKWLDELDKDDSVIVLTETTSNINHPNFFSSIDQIIAPLTEKEQKELQPDLLLTFGGLIVSKKIKALLRKFQAKAHWHIDEISANDTFFCLSNHLEISPNTFFEIFLPRITHYAKSNYKEHWTSVKKHRLEKHAQYLNELPFSDFKVFSALVKSLPANSILQAGNSSTIRYLQLFKLNKTIQVFCNRGTSGIDGSTSTAIGCAAINTKPTIFITGDLSFFYDSNALWNSHIPSNFKIIVINNGGGGIFRILPGHKNTDNFDEFFETKHELTAEHLCSMYGFDYLKALNENELSDHLKSFYKKSKQPRLLEIFTPRVFNDEVLLDYFNFIK